jgi:3-hydroxyisobutyrate dehydrogenase-like beta-hydroxyacid dehydrogenase
MKIAFIGGGMVGKSFSEAFSANGMEVKWICDAKPTPELKEFARAIGAEVVTEPGAWLKQADLVISAVFGTVAYDVAKAAMSQMQPESTFVDMTTADPSDMEKAFEVAKKHSVDFVDVAITGAVNLHGAKTPLLCAGEKAAEVADIFKKLGTPIQVVGEKPGDAAALKLLRSIFTKGLEALSIECLLTAEKRGLRNEIHEILSDVDKGSLRALMESMVSTHIEHSARRQKEVIEAQRQMQQADVIPLVTKAVEKLFARTAERQLKTPYTGKSIESALAWLTQCAKESKGNALSELERNALLSTELMK